MTLPMGGLSRYEGAHFSALTPSDGLAEDRADNIAANREGKLWIRAWGSPEVPCFDREAFTGDEPQADDMTCVVVKVEA